MAISTIQQVKTPKAAPPALDRQPLKIAIARRYYSLQRGGAERYCVNLSRQLLKLGHDVSFVGEGIADELSDELPFFPVRVQSSTSSARNRSFAENCGKVIAGQKFDIAYGLGRSLGVDLFRVTERLQSHWLNVHYRNRAHRFLQQLNPRHRTLIELERTICQSPHTRRIVTISSVDGALLQRYYDVPPEKICTIYNGVDIDHFHPRTQQFSAEVRREWGIGEHDPLITFASMDFAGKGLRTILESLRAARNQEIQLLVLGRGPQRKFARLAKRLGVANRVTFAGRQDKIERFYAAGDLMVLPTIYEPFPNVVVESMACGVPAITTATAGGADMIDEGTTGYLLPDSWAVRELAERLDHHFSKTDIQRELMATASRAKTATMTVENNARQVSELFYEVLRDKSRV